MTYRLKFLPVALKEWEKLAPPLREQFKKKLSERLEAPKVPSARLHGFDEVYKIKLRAAGYRLAYQVFDDAVVVMVLAVGKRERGEVYKKLAARTSDEH
jgi:mRNA interferase RelE/StbE